MDDSAVRVFVTGATGSIGSRLVQRLSQAGRCVRVLVRDLAQVRKLHLTASVEAIQGDLMQPASLHGLMSGCSAAYHCAAKLTGSDWSRFRAVNVTGMQALLEQACRAGIERFVHVSTIGVYGCAEAQGIDESFPWPVDQYAYFVTKREAEQAVWSAAGSVPVVVARLGDVFGPGQQVWTTDLIEKIQRGILKPPVDRDSGIFNPVYIENAVDVLVLMECHPAALRQAFNVVDGTPMLFSDYIRRLTRMAGKRTFAVPGVLLRTAASALMMLDLVRGREASVKPGDVDYLLHKATISGDKLHCMLGWGPAVSEEEAFTLTERWLRTEGYIT